MAVILNTSEDFIERTEKCKILLELSSFYLSIDNNESVGNSIGKSALILASSIENPNVSLKYYNQYLEIKREMHSWNIEPQIIKQIEILVEKSTKIKTQCNAFILLSDYYLTAYEADIAKVYASKAMQLAKQTNNDTLIIKSHLAMGECFNKEMEKVDAFQEFATAVTRSERLGNTELAILCYENLANFYAKYTNLDFNFNPESKYNLELEAMYGSLNYPEANFEKKSESIINQTTKVKGAFNNAQVSNDALVTINTFQGRVYLK